MIIAVYDWNLLSVIAKNMGQLLDLSEQHHATTRKWIVLVCTVPLEFRKVLGTITTLQNTGTTIGAEAHPSS